VHLPALGKDRDNHPSEQPDPICEPPAGGQVFTGCQPTGKAYGRMSMEELYVSLFPVAESQGELLFFTINIMVQDEKIIYRLCPTENELLKRRKPDDNIILVFTDRQ
jgi:hypothetical protein